MRKTLLLIAIAMVGWACNSDSTTDGGSDATTEPVVDLCDFNAYVAAGGAGHTCPHVSTRVCFYDPSCEAGNGCTCSASSSGPTWQCNTPDECKNPCGNSSPAVDSGCDAGDAASPNDAAIEDAGADATPDAADGD